MVTGAAGVSARSPLQFLATVAFRSRRRLGSPIISQAWVRARSSSAKSSLDPAKPLEKERWAGAVDSAGSTTFANVLAMTRYGGLWIRWRHGFADFGRAIYSTRCFAVRDRVDHV